MIMYIENLECAKNIEVKNFDKSIIDNGWRMFIN